MNNTQLNENEIRDLRQRGLINAEEFAFKAGDLIIAENPVTGESVPKKVSLYKFSF